MVLSTNERDKVMAKTIINKSQSGAPYGYRSVREEVPGYGVIQFGVVKNREPQRLPWWQKPSAIPADMRAEAEKVAREHSTTEKEFEWRMSNWQAVMTGWSYAVRCYYPWFMYSPGQALEYVAAICMHDWVKDREYRDGNDILGTYDIGYINKCSKCSKEDYVRTAFNNYSGD